MTNLPDAPFSARNRGAHRQIDLDFPITAKIGLSHLLLDLINRDFISNWTTVANELQRIARIPPIEYETSKVASYQLAKKHAQEALGVLHWDKTYDFCERLYSYLAKEIGYNQYDEYHVVTSKSEVQAFIASGLQRLFAEEELAFEFKDGLVLRRGRKHTVDITTRAQVVLGDSRLLGARKHYDKAMKFFRERTNPDYENCVKEAVCAVEAAGKALFPTAKATTLGDLAKWLGNTKEVTVPKTLAQITTAIYAYRSGGQGVGHGGAEGGAATAEVAEYVLAVCASQIIYFVDVSNPPESDVVF